MSKSKNIDIVKNALAEDQAFNDITSKLLIPAQQTSSASIIAKQNGILCGISYAKEAFRQIDPNLRIIKPANDGHKITKGTVVLTVKGRTRAILSAERTALNFLSHLSGISTNVALYTNQIKHKHLQILDTRKTTPGLRTCEKYAVVCGGGTNHRMDLSDMIMIKDNHREFTKFHLTELIHKIRKQTKMKIIVEVDDLAQFKDAIIAKPDIILLDNMNISQIKHAVVMRNSFSKSGKPLLEVSGGINLKNIKKYAQTGIDRISIGALTHSAQSLDFSLEIQS